MRILKRVEICQIAANMDDQGDNRLSLGEVEVVLKSQVRETCKEIGEKMMKMETLQEFHALRVKLIQGEMPE